MCMVNSSLVLKTFPQVGHVNLFGAGVLSGGGEGGYGGSGGGDGGGGAVSSDGSLGSLL